MSSQKKKNTLSFSKKHSLQSVLYLEFDFCYTVYWFSLIIFKEPIKSGNDFITIKSNFSSEKYLKFNNIIELYYSELRIKGIQLIIYNNFVYKCMRKINSRKESLQSPSTK